MLFFTLIHDMKLQVNATDMVHGSTSACMRSLECSCLSSLFVCEREGGGEGKEGAIFLSWQR